MNLWLKFQRKVQRFIQLKVLSLSHSKTTKANPGGLIASLLSFTLILSLSLPLPDSPFDFTILASCIFSTCKFLAVN